jgi:DNA-binding LacI/PurR family transcriptional regulator
LEVVSFSDCPPVMFRPGRDVHRIVQRAHEMGQMAAERLQRRMKGEVMPTEVLRVPAQVYPAGKTASPSLVKE